MKKLITLVFIFYTFFHSDAQNPLEPVLKKYFRSHPFNMLFSKFINTLKKDTLFRIDEYARRTDSSLFYLSGTYKKFNPFHYQASEVRLTVAEHQFLHSDSLKTLDTIIYFQIMGITDSSAAKKEAVISEFNKLHNKISDQFYLNNYDFLQKNGIDVAEIHNYFLSGFSVSPLTIAWGLLTESNQYSFIVTIRCKIKENLADLVLAPGEF